MKITSTLFASILLSLAACEGETPRPPRADETCWGQVETQQAGSEYCEPQQCFKKLVPIKTDTASGPGFFCHNPTPGGLCTRVVPLPDGTIPYREQLFTIEGTSPAWTVHLSFDLRLMVDGYSLENFRKYLLGAYAAFPLTAEYAVLSANPLELADVEIVSYEGGRLHMRFDAFAMRTSAIIETPTHLCGGLHTCDHTSCDYASEDAEGTGASVLAEIDIKAPIQQLEP